MQIMPVRIRKPNTVLPVFIDFAFDFIILPSIASFFKQVDM